jgi:hypothetical protein
MKKVTLRGFEKCQNSEEYYRLLEVAGEGPYALGEDLPNTLEETLQMEELERLDRKVSSDLGKLRGYTISPEEARRKRLIEIGEKIARDRGCL